MFIVYRNSRDNLTWLRVLSIYSVCSDCTYGLHTHSANLCISLPTKALICKIFLNPSLYTHFKTKDKWHEISKTLELFNKRITDGHCIGGAIFNIWLNKKIIKLNIVYSDRVFEQQTSWIFWNSSVIINNVMKRQKCDDIGLLLTLSKEENSLWKITLPPTRNQICWYFFGGGKLSLPAPSHSHAGKLAVTEDIQLSAFCLNNWLDRVIDT